LLLAILSLKIFVSPGGKLRNSVPPGGPVTFIKVRRGWLAQTVGVEDFNFP